MSKPTKQVIVIRKDLKMRKGKEIAQGAHAAMAFLTKEISYTTWKHRIIANKRISLAAKEWMEDSFRKVTLQIDSEQELLDIAEQAKQAGIECHVITDAGVTEFNGVPTKTCLALGPDYDEKIDPITKDLKLY